MEFANKHGRNLGASPLLIRAASEADEPDILRLINRADYVHMNADWSISADWWQQHGVVVALRDNTPSAVVAATCEPCPIAWIRALAVDMSTPSYALRKLMPHIKLAMQALDATQLACMSISRWLDRELAHNGFAPVAELETMERAPSQLGDDADISIWIRDVISADFSTLFQLDQLAFPNPLWWQSPRYFERAHKEAVSFTLAVIDGETAGYQLTVRSSSRGAHIVRLSVHPAFQGRGVGRSLMTHVIRYCQQHQLHKLTLNTQQDNDASHRLYQHFGFEPTGQRFKVWTANLPPTP